MSTVCPWLRLFPTSQATSVLIGLKERTFVSLLLYVSDSSLGVPWDINPYSSIVGDCTPPCALVALTIDCLHYFDKNKLDLMSPGWKEKGRHRKKSSPVPSLDITISTGDRNYLTGSHATAQLGRSLSL